MCIFCLHLVQNNVAGRFFGKMFCRKVILLLFLVHLSYCDWISEWMSPIQKQFSRARASARRANPPMTPKSLDDEDMRMIQVPKDIPETTESLPRVYTPAQIGSNENLPFNGISTANLKLQLENALQTAENLVQTLKSQIITIASKENVLKEAIANGRSGVTTVTVSTVEQAPRTYIIREGFWTLCNGMVQFPPADRAPSTSMFEQLFSAPRCIGNEIQSKQDPCVFNSVIKYETIPTRRGLEYKEDDFLCLKSTFRNTLEQYLSVPRHVINDTCKQGSVRSVPEYTEQCGVRIMAEYSYYPHKSSAAAVLPLEYCTEKDGSCKMIVAWHMTNTTIENFEYLRDEYNFKKFFMKPDRYVEHVM